MADHMLEILSQCHVINQSDWEMIRNFAHTVIFEGAQGVQLDATRGTVPYVTSSNTTYENAYELLKGWNGEIERWGCMRTYATRHGPGPFPEEILSPWLLESFPEAHNRNNAFQGEWRVGYHDWDVLRNSIAILGGVDYLSVSHYDVYPYDPADLGVPIGMKAYGPTREDRRILK